jgi:hypothetical protein
MIDPEVAQFVAFKAGQVPGVPLALTCYWFAALAAGILAGFLSGGLLGWWLRGYSRRLALHEDDK